MTALDTQAALDEIAGAVRYLAGHTRTSGKVGVMGFCMGGALSFAAAAALPELKAVVPFYGLPSPAPDYSKVKAPILAHFAARDEWATPAGAEAIKKELEARGQPMELHVYDADHAFVNDTRPDVYNAAAAKLAWDRSVEFLEQHLG
jgi:carboxymethylenebutenolidase